MSWSGRRDSEMVVKPAMSEKKMVTTWVGSGGERGRGRSERGRQTDIDREVDRQTDKERQTDGQRPQG
jgi:hypothetical protein